MADRPSFPWLALFLALLFSVAWTALVLTRNNLDRRGIDIVNHAIMIHQMAAGSGADDPVLGNLGHYPHGSHLLASWFVPLFHGNAIQAMRCLALFALLTMLIAQYGLLRKLMPAAAAIIVLVVWQYVCTWMGVADVNHFGKATYNLSRAVGAAALWLILLSLVTSPLPERFAALNHILATGLAAFAWTCHLGPGAIAFGLLGLIHFLALFRDRRRDALIGLAVTTLTLAAVCIASNSWKYMAGYAGADGWLPIAGEWILALWIPTWFVAGFLLARHLWTGDEPDRLIQVLCCGLFVSGGLQGYLMIRMLAFGTVAPYAVKSILFTTFALASLLWIVWTMRFVVPDLFVVPPSGGSGEDRLKVELRTNTQRLLRAGAMLSVIGGLVFVLHRDMRRPSFGKDRDLAQVVKTLSQHREELAGAFYYDPRQPFGSFFASAVGLQIDEGRVQGAFAVLRGLDPTAVADTPVARAAPVADAAPGSPYLPMTTLLIPAGEDPAVSLRGLPVASVERFGPFWRCLLQRGGRRP